MTQINHSTLLAVGFTQVHMNLQAFYFLDIDAETPNFYISINYIDKTAKLYYEEKASQTVNSIEDIVKTIKNLTGITI